MKKYIPIGTAVLVAINIILFFIVEFTSPAGSEDMEHMIAFGAMYSPKFFEEGQYYRLFTEMFLHFGAAHVFNNMLALWFIGGEVEKRYGTFWYLCIYILSGLTAGAASLAYHTYIGEEPVSAGASGAIFGIVGALFYLMVKNWKKAGGYHVRRMILFLFFSAGAAYFSVGIDWMAHLAGFLGGFLLGVILKVDGGTRR